MSEPHHDPDLCKRLSENVFGKNIDHHPNQIIRDFYDYCCDPDQLWVLQRKIVVEKGYNFDLAWHDGEATAIFWGEHPSEHIGRDSHPLKATALAADDIKERMELRSARGH